MQEVRIVFKVKDFVMPKLDAVVILFVLFIAVTLMEAFGMKPDQSLLTAIFVALQLTPPKPNAQ